METTGETDLLSADSLLELNAVMQSSNSKRAKQKKNRPHLIGNSVADSHFNRLFTVNRNVLSRTRETLENHLMKRIAMLNSDRRAGSTSRQMEEIPPMLSPRDTLNQRDSLLSNSLKSPQIISRNQGIPGGTQTRYRSNDRSIPSRIIKRNEDLRMLSLMQRSKRLSKNFYQ